MDTPGRKGRPLPARAFSPAAIAAGRANTGRGDGEGPGWVTGLCTRACVCVAHAHALHGRLPPGHRNDPRVRVSVPPNT